MPAGAGNRPPAAHASSDDIARAWELYHIERVGSVRKVADLMGVSTGTAHNWLVTAREALPWIRALDRAEHRDGMVGRLLTYLSWLMDQKNTGRDPLEVIKVALQVEDRLRAVLGLDAPARIQMDDRREPEVRTDVIEAVREVERRAAVERLELEEGLS